MIHTEENEHDYKSFLVTCSCHDLSHAVRLSYFIEKDSAGYRHINDAYIEVVLNPFWPWYKRLWLALSYFINPFLPNRRSYYDSILLNMKDIQGLSNVLFCIVKEEEEMRGAAKADPNETIRYEVEPVPGSVVKLTDEEKRGLNTGKTAI